MLHNLSQFLMYLLPYIGTRLFAYPQPYGNCSGFSLLTAAFKMSGVPNQQTSHRADDSMDSAESNNSYLLVLNITNRLSSLMRSYYLSIQGS